VGRAIQGYLDRYLGSDAKGRPGVAWELEFFLGNLPKVPPLEIYPVLPEGLFKALLASSSAEVRELLLFVLAGSFYRDPDQPHAWISRLLVDLVESAAPDSREQQLAILLLSRPRVFPYEFAQSSRKPSDWYSAQWQAGPDQQPSDRLVLSRSLGGIGSEKSEKGIKLLLKLFRSARSPVTRQYILESLDLAEGRSQALLVEILQDAYGPAFRETVMRSYSLRVKSPALEKLVVEQYSSTRDNELKRRMLRWMYQNSSLRRLALADMHSTDDSLATNVIAYLRGIELKQIDPVLVRIRLLRKRKRASGIALLSGGFKKHEQAIRIFLRDTLRTTALASEKGDVLRTLFQRGRENQATRAVFLRLAKEVVADSSEHEDLREQAASLLELDAQLQREG